MAIYNKGKLAREQARRIFIYVVEKMATRKKLYLRSASGDEEEEEENR